MRSRNGEYLVVAVAVGTNKGEVDADDDEDDDLDESNADDGFDDDDDREILLLENAKDSSTKNDDDKRSSAAVVTTKSVNTADGDDKVFFLRLLRLRRGVGVLLRSWRRRPMMGQAGCNGQLAPSPVAAVAAAAAAASSSSIMMIILSAGH